MDEVFEHRLPGRRLIVWVALVVMGFLLALAVGKGAPWYVWVIWIPTTAAILWMIGANPVSGMRLDERALTLSPWLRPRRVPLAEIDHVEIVHWSDSTDVRLHLVSGETIVTFGGDMPAASVVRSEFSARGVRVVEG